MIIFQETMKNIKCEVLEFKIKNQNQLKKELISPKLTFQTRYLGHEFDVIQSEKTTTLNSQPIQC
jgi:hypothetical protein